MRHEYGTHGLVTFSLIALVACAGGKTSSAGYVQPPSQPVAVGISQRVTSINTANITTVSYTIARVWRALPHAYDSLAIPLTVFDNAKHLIGNQGMKIRQKLGNVALSKYI